MRKIIAEMCVTPSGYLDLDERDPLDMVSAQSPDKRLYNEHYDTIFFGRKTYEKMTSLATHAGYDENNVVNKMRKYVFSDAYRHLSGNAMVIYSNLRQEVERIRDEEGLDIWLYGGAGIISRFAADGLIDELVVYIHPFLTDRATRLLSPKLALHLKSCDTLDSGIVKLNYEVIKNQRA